MRMLALIQLAWDLRAALREAIGAHRDVAVLIDDLEILARSLHSDYALLSQVDGVMRADVQNGLMHALKTCHGILTDVKTNADEYLAGMSGRASRSWRFSRHSDIWRILGNNDEVTRLRRRIYEQLRLIHAYASFARSQPDDTDSKIDLSSMTPSYILPSKISGTQILATSTTLEISQLASLGCDIQRVAALRSFVMLLCLAIVFASADAPGYSCRLAPIMSMLQPLMRVVRPHGNSVQHSAL